MPHSSDRRPSFPCPNGHARWTTLLVALLLLIAAGGTPRSAQAQADTSPPDLTARTVEVTDEVYAGNKTPKEAHRAAIEKAQAEAIRQAIGTQVQTQRRSSQIETGDEVVSRFSQVVRTGASGRVVESEVLDEERVERAGELFHRVRLRATVEPTTGRPAPGFTVSLQLTDDDRTFVDRGALEDSDEIVAEMEVSKNAYVTLFNVKTDTLEVLWPNSITERLAIDPFLPADSTIQFPPPGLRARGLHLRVNVPEGRARTTERLVAVATKQQVPFLDVPDYEVEDGTLTTAQATLQALNRWLVKIPLGQRAIQSVTYDVTRDTE